MSEMTTVITILVFAWLGVSLARANIPTVPALAILAIAAAGWGALRMMIGI